ncbi:hypothetical protein QBC44DRAFT_324076 [Cladorrhinum sp. PSN332]|nr:hypothetical protein QBC44DRAFT_324076 [Cladorrhinum sp. PSN332]
MRLGGYASVFTLVSLAARLLWGGQIQSVRLDGPQTPVSPEGTPSCSFDTTSVFSSLSLQVANRIFSARLLFLVHVCSPSVSAGCGFH